jgi:branched-chain amino acid transport system ATP-binding protein
LNGRSHVSDDAQVAAHLDTNGIVLEAKELVVGYGSVPVVHGLNLVVKRGQITALLGPNGAGKSTTLLALAGELLQTAGRVFLDGTPVATPLHKRTRQGLVFVPEQRAILRSLSCRDNLRLGRANLKVALDLFPALTPRLKVPAGLLSGGEQQMLTLGRALSMKPRILLVDEVSLGLAPMIIRQLFEVLRVAANGGAGILLVEQNVRLTLAIADYAYIMRRGKVVLEGPAAELRGRIDEIEKVYLSAGA